jgi:AcrR family transcriptional regulator
MTPLERSAERRERLMTTGLELFGTVGYNNTSVRALSAAASLNSRYFYEAFESREDLLYNVYQRIVAEMITNVAEAVQKENNLLDQTRAGIRAGWTTVTEDPRKARIIAREVVGVSERLEKLRRETRHTLAKLTADEAVALAPTGTRFRLDPILVARSLIGAVVEILLDWSNGDIDATVDEIVEHFTTLFTTAAYAAIEPGTPPPEVQTPNP